METIAAKNRLEALHKFRQAELVKAIEKERELLRLLQVKSEKLVNDYLIKNEHTQLSYLPKDQQAEYVALPKSGILDKLLNYLRSI